MSQTAITNANHRYHHQRQCHQTDNASTPTRHTTTTNPQTTTTMAPATVTARHERPPQHQDQDQHPHDDDIVNFVYYVSTIAYDPFAVTDGHHTHTTTAATTITTSTTTVSLGPPTMPRKYGVAYRFEISLLWLTLPLFTSSHVEIIVFA